MPGRLTGKVAFITGAARGQGRAEAVRFAEEGASLILLDTKLELDSLIYPASTEEDLRETVRLCEQYDSRVIASTADVRDLGALSSAVADGVAELGGLDIIVANAGITTMGRLVAKDLYAPVLDVLSEQDWQDMIDINLTGVYHTIRVAAPFMIEQGRGGVILMTSSGAGLRGAPNIGHYAAAKHGVVGLAKSLARELGQHRIRVNVVCPGNTNTNMLQNETMYRIYRPDLEHPSQQEFSEVASRMTALPVPWVEPEDIANGMLFLASDEARYVTGVALSVDAGLSA
jgi:(+)-trans-carveol dehydrogenase/(-)-trans-carveol dehydrogenase